ncbi:MAG TPA: hypothetical protein GX703_01100 [Erysipelothrix sp.]|jgi:thiol-disulfide isomerase/thioredoxin|nr:hypothetical protein [Erysipelothrix sp.]
MLIDLTCPNCQHQQEFQIYPEINVSKEPALKNMVFNFQLFKDTCENCEKIIPVAYATIYHDFDQKFIVVLDPTRQKTLTEVNQELEKEFGELKGYTIRLVHNPDDLKEKIQLRDSHYDDRLVEIIKQYYVASALDKNPELKLNAVLFNRGLTHNEIVLITADQQKLSAELNEEILNHLSTLYKKKIAELTLEGANRIDGVWVSHVLETKH